MQHQSGDDIGVFLTVCEAGSFAQAAPRLGLTASAVAKAVARVEDRLRVTLFKRTTRRLSLTPEGLAYRDTCRSARAQIARTEAAIAGQGDEPAGELAVSLPPLFGTEIIAPALLALTRDWPRLRLRLETSVGPADLLGESTDLAVRIGALPDRASLIARRLGTQHLSLCASAAYFAGHPPPQNLRDLATHELIAGTGPAGLWQFRTPDGERMTWQPPARLLLEGSALTLAAIRAGHGLGLVPSWLVRDEIAQGRLVAVLADRLDGHLPVHALWPATDFMRPRLRVAIDAVVKAAARVLQP